MPRVCRKDRTVCLSLSLRQCQRARPGLTVCSGQGEGRRRLRQQGLFCPSVHGPAEPRLWLLPRGQQSPSGNHIQPGLERSKHKPGKRLKPSSFCCFASVPMRNNGSHCQSSWDSRAFLWPPLARVGCSEALAAQHVTKSVGQREEYLPSKAREAVELLRALISSSQAGRGITCSITSLWPSWARLWLLFQWLGTSLPAFLITVSHRVFPPCLHVSPSTDSGLCVAF